MQPIELKLNRILADDIMEDAANDLVLIIEDDTSSTSDTSGVEKVASSAAKGLTADTKEELQTPADSDKSTPKGPAKPDTLAKILHFIAEHYPRTASNIIKALKYYEANPQKYRGTVIQWLRTKAIPSLEKRLDYLGREDSVARYLLDKLSVLKKASKPEEAPTDKTPAQHATA